MRRDLPRSVTTGRLTGGAGTRRGSAHAVRPRPLLTLKSVVLAIALVSLSSALCYISPLLRVSYVTVVGGSTITPDKVIETANVEGQNILAVDREEVARSVAQIPVVKSARVTRKLPNGVVIAIEERKPWAVWQAQDAKYVIDEEGVVMSSGSPPQGLITIVDTGNQSVRVGNRVEPKAVEMAFQLTQLLPKEVNALPKRFEYSQAAGLMVVSDKGWQARFGDAEDLEYKVATLKGVLAAAAERKTRVDLIDLRFGGRPFYR